MNSLNRAQLIGNVTREPELKHTRAGQPVTTIGLATNRSWKDSAGERHDDVEYHNIVCWGRLAEIACQFLFKGAKAYFSGRLQTRSWDDESGTKHFRTEVVSEDMIVLSPRRDNVQGGMAYDEGEYIPEPISGDDMSMDEEISPDDLPF